MIVLFGNAFSRVLVQRAMTTMTVPYVDFLTGNLLEKVLALAWNAVPLSLISVVLRIVVIPIIIFRIDDAFQYDADYRAASVEKNSEKERSKHKITNKLRDLSFLARCYFESTLPSLFIF